MVRKVQNLIIVFFFICCLPLVSSLAIEQGTNRTLVFYPRVNGAITDNVLCNITILYPNNSVMVDFTPLTDDGDKFTYELIDNLTSLRGEYSGSVTCISPSGENQTESFEYIVNLGGVNPSQQRTDTLTRTLYFIFGIGIILFISFFFVRQLPIKATIFLLALLFILIGVNIVFITLQDEIVNSKLESFFSFFTSISFYIYWFVGMLIGIIWIITFFVTIFQKMQSSKEAKNAI